MLICNPLAGKTTLVNHILSQDHGRRIEFGEVGIDDELIKGRENLEGEGDLTILENGCVCCTVREDLVQAVSSLVERGGFDHIVLETTGTC
jgi:G3E family GTPase